MTHEQELSEKFISEFKDHVNWHIISTNYNWPEFSEEFKTIFKDNLTYETRYLSKDFLMKHKYILRWDQISSRRMSEDTIREMQEFVDWKMISTIVYRFYS
jgi:molybdopterin/thiamine biosynthesis adenylyltransferase